jgi:hypothetical protein
VRPKTNRILLVAVIAATFCVFLIDLTLRGGVGTFTVLFSVFTIWQALRTYMVRTTFTRTRVKHRSILGVWHAAEYSKLLVLSGWPASIRLVGEDTEGQEHQNRHFERGWRY